MQVTGRGGGSCCFCCLWGQSEKVFCAGGGGCGDGCGDRQSCVGEVGALGLCPTLGRQVGKQLLCAQCVLCASADLHRASI